MIITNIQNLNSRRQSYYPFDSLSTLQMDNMVFPVNLIKSLNIQVQSAVFPLQITSFQVWQNEVVVCCIKDALHDIIGYIKFESPSIGYVADQQNRPIGGISFLPQLYTWLYKTINDVYYKNLQPAPGAFIISSQCITCVHYIGFKGIFVNNIYAGNTVTLNFQRNIQCITELNELKLSLCADYVNTKSILVQSQDNQSQQEVPIIYVNGVDLTNKMLIIKHRTLSDLRIKTEPGKISFIGVRDVV